MTRCTTLISRKSPRTAVGRQARATRRVIAADIIRAQTDAGISRRAMARAAGIDPGFLSQILAGDREPSISVLVALAEALGGRISFRLDPGTGPRIYDRIQARIVEELLRVVHARWRRSLEVPVVRPVRGFIDIVLDQIDPPTIIATEVQSRIDRLEQQLRWMAEKASALPSSDVWAMLTGDPRISRLLVLRSTEATRSLARRFETTLRTAYPARTSDAVLALTTATAPWPAAAILWADVRGDVVRLMDGPPRGVGLGR